VTVTQTADVMWTEGGLPLWLVATAGGMIVMGGRSLLLNMLKRYEFHLISVTPTQSFSNLTRTWRGFM